MRYMNMKSALIKTALAATVLLSASATALAQQVINLTVAPTTTTLSDGNVVPMWGYSCGAVATGSTAACAAANPAVAAAQAAVTAGTATPAQISQATTWSPVIITVPSGPGLTVNLTNNLKFPIGAATPTATIPTSLVILGQLGGGLGTTATSTASPDHSQVRSQSWYTAGGTAPPSSQAPLQGNRVQSFATEVAAAGVAPVAPQVASGSPVTWNNLQPGTYLIESGTHPSIQVPMGLYGVLVVTDATTGTAYGTAGAAGAVTYAADIPLVMGEIDPAQNAAVNAAVNAAFFSETAVWSGLPGACGNPATTFSATVPACYPPVVNYSPRYYLINGRTFDATNAAASVFPVNPLTGATTSVTGNVLVRLVNAGLKMHVPSIVGAQTSVISGTATTAVTTAGMSLVAEDGNVLPGQTRVQSEVFMAAGKTYDVLISAPSTCTPATGATTCTNTALPIYDRQLSLSANATGRDGGMLAYIDWTAKGFGVTGGGGAAVIAATTNTGANSPFVAAAANADTYYLTAPTGGTTLALTISDPSKGVIANDVRVYGVTLLTQAASGLVALNPDGTFTYTPTAGSTQTTDSFTYCANSAFTPASPPVTNAPGATFGTCSSTSLQATVTLSPATIEAATGITCAAIPTFTATATTLSIKPPGVLAGCKDAAGYPLTISGATLSAPLSVTLAAAAGTTGSGTATVDSNGGFTATGGAGTYTFAFTVQNSQGTVIGAPVTATVVFPQPTGLTVTVLDGADHVTQITDYRWIIEEDRTFFVNPACTTNPLPAGCPTVPSINGPINYGTNFHTSFMPVVAAGCTGPLSCESGQTMQGASVVCDVGNGVCRAGAQQAQTYPNQVALDPTKRYYISIFPGDAANPWNKGNLYQGAPICVASGGVSTNNTTCGHGMGGAPIAAPVTCVTTSAGATTCSGATTAGAVVTCTPISPATSCVPAGVNFAGVQVYVVPTPLPTATLSVFVYEDDYPLNGEWSAGGGVDVIAPNEPGLGGFQITLLDQAGQTGAATGTPTYDMFNEPLANALAGKIDPVTGLDACPVSSVASANGAYNTANATAIAAGTVTPLSTSTGMIITCPKYESDGKTLSPLAGQAVVKYLYPGRYSVVANAGASRIALGEEWLQTNTLDGQKGHDSFMRVGEPGYFQEFGPAGFHVSIGFANPKIINERRTNSGNTGMCDAGGGNLACPYTVRGKVTGSRLSRTPDQRLYSSGSRAALSFTQCYVALGDPDGPAIAFAKCDADGNFVLPNVPPGNWEVTTFDQWNDQIIDGITQPVSVGCSGNVGGLCSSGNTIASTANTTCGGPGTTGTTCDMGEIGVHQWQADLYTRTFIDISTNSALSGSGVSDSTKPGLALAATNVRYRDGSFSDFNNTDLNGYANFNEEFPLFNWYVVETDSTRYKTTGVHVIYDAGGPADGSNSCSNSSLGNSPAPATNLSPCGASTTAQGLANTYEKFPLPSDLSVPGAVYCSNADCTGQSIANGPVPSTTATFSTGRIDPPFWFGSYGWQGYIGQGNFLEFGKKPFATNETGPIHGHVVYASTRPFDNPQLLLQAKWEPLVPHVQINLYQEGVGADGVTPTLTLVDHTATSSWDDWAQGFRSDGKPNMNCPGQQPGLPTGNDPFYYALQNQPHYLDWYNSVHNGGTLHTLPYSSQYKCYDGMHTWNQLQPAQYDGMYSFPSVTQLDPKTGKPAGTNCTACVPNPDTTDPYRAGTPMLPAGKYVVEVVVPPGYELVKEEDKNILIGDNFIAPAALQFNSLGGSVYILPDQAALSAAYNPLNKQNQTNGLGRNPALVSNEGDTGSVEEYWPCVGTVRQVPDYISLFPQSKEIAPFAGAYRPLCDRKEVTLNYQQSPLAKFYIFTSTHLSSHFQGIILDDFAAEFDPFSPQFGEKFAPSYLPVAVKDWTGNAVNRVYSDQFGLYNGLNYSTWEVNPPNPTGYAPTMMVMCMNDAGMTGAPDPLFQPGYSQFCYELPFMPATTGYFDTPVVPVEAFASGSYNRPDCAYPDATPAIASVVNTAAEVSGTGTLPAGSGPWLGGVGSGHTLTINALGDQSVDWYGYTGPSIPTPPYNQAKITRHYGFGATRGTVTIGGVNATISAWSDTQITVYLPNGALNNSTGVPLCAVQQQAMFAPGVTTSANCGELVITTAQGRQSIDTVTVTIGGKAPTVVQPGNTIQSAIDSALPGDMIIVPAGVYNEMLVMWKPVRLQGVGAASAVVDASTQPAGKLLNPWRTKMVALFGLTPDGRPNSTTAGCALDGTSINVGTAANPLYQAFCNFPSMQVDRLPFEATLGWDATLNGNLAEQLIEPSLLGAYEGAAITVVAKGVKFPEGTSILDAYGATTGTPGASFPTNTTLLSAADCSTVVSFTTAVTLQPGSTTFSLASLPANGQLDVGMTVSGPGIPAGTTITAVTLVPAIPAGPGVKAVPRSYTIQLSAANTLTASATETITVASQLGAQTDASNVTNPYPSNFYCNPSSIDGLGIRNSSQGGGGIFAHAYAHNLQIANNRVSNNTGTMSGGITVGTGEHPDITISGQTILNYPTSCETSAFNNVSLPFCFNMNLNIHHNAVLYNSSMGDELFSSTPAGAGGVSLNTGADYYSFTNNWVCGNLSSGDGGGFSHIGFSKYGDIEHNTIIFNQSTNPSITTNGGGLLVMGAPDADPTTCGVATDQDCVPPPGTISPSDGTGPGLTINANLILGNAADSGSGGGLRMQGVNGTDVLNLPDGATWCTADLGAGTPTQVGQGGGTGNSCTRVLRPGHSPGDACTRGHATPIPNGPLCYWNSVAIENNIIVNNVAGWDGAGVSLYDALAVNMMNNTIASNDATASSGTLLQSLYAPLASADAPGSRVTCGSGQSCPQVAGLVSVNNSAVLTANIQALPTFATQSSTVTATTSNTTGTGAHGQFVLTNFLPPSLHAGMIVSGAGIPANTTVTSVTATGGARGATNYTVALSQTVTATTNDVITISYPANELNASITCPAGHGVPVAGGQPSCFNNSIPLLLNEVIWGNRSFYIGVGNGGSATTYQNQQNLITLYNGNDTLGTSTVANQNTTGQCVGASYYWDLGFRGDPAPSSNVASGFVPLQSYVTSNVYATGAGALPTGASYYINTTNPLFLSMYCNGSRTPPELGSGGFQVPPGVNEFNAYPNPAFTLNPSGVVDEGNNWVNVRWGPLALVSPLNLNVPTGTGSNVPLGNYGLQPTSSAIQNATPSVSIPGPGGTAVPVYAPPTDFYGTARAGKYDVGAVESTKARAVIVVNSSTLGTFSASLGGSSGAQAVTVSNTGGAAANLGLVIAPASFHLATPAPNGACQAVLNAGTNCTVTLVYTPTQAGTVQGTLEVTATDQNGVSLPVTGSPVALTGVTFVAPTLTSISPTSGARGSTVPVTLTGTNLAGATAVAMSGTGVTCTITGTSTATTVTANCAITGTAATGARTVTVTTLPGVTASLAGAFTVTVPTFTGVSPATGLRGTTGNIVTLTGTGLAGSTGVTMSGTGVACTVTGTTATTVTASCNIAVGAATGARNVTVATLGGTITLNGAYTVTAPTLTGISPATGVRPSTAFAVTLTGTNLGGANAVTMSGTGVTCTITGTPTATQVTANCAITSGATLSARTVTVGTAANGNATLPGAFTP